MSHVASLVDCKFLISKGANDLSSCSKILCTYIGEAFAQLRINLLQHLAESLDMDLSALEFMMKEFPEVKERDEMRKIVGRYGLTGQQQVGSMSMHIDTKY